MEDWTCVLRNDNASGQVHGDETELAAALDELVRLRDELHVLDPRVRVHEQAPRHALGFLKNLPFFAVRVLRTR